MKKLIFICLAFLFSSCASMKELHFVKEINGDADIERQQRASERQQLKIQEEEKIVARQANLVQGNSFDAFKSHWGNSDSVELKNGIYYHHYDQYDPPLIVGVKDNKVESWEQNRFLIAEEGNSQYRKATLNEQKRANRIGTVGLFRKK